MSVSHGAVEAVWRRIESGRLVGALTRITGDFAAAEDLAQDALERALTQWPTDGIPDHPASWLMATAKHIAVDRYRRQQTLTRKLVDLAHQHTPDATVLTVSGRHAVLVELNLAGRAGVTAATARFLALFDRTFPGEQVAGPPSPERVSAYQGCWLAREEIIQRFRLRPGPRG